MNLIKIETPELNAIEKSKAEQIKATFLPMAEMLETFEAAYDEVIADSEKEITNETTAKAKRLRLDIAKVRILTDKNRKDQKAEYLRAGQAIDAVSKILTWAVSDKETKLKEIEDYFEIQEQKKREALQIERVEMLSKFVEDAAERDLASMDCDVWEAYYQTKQREYNDRILAEKNAEIARVEKEKAEAKERERIRKENETLKKEAEANRKKQEAEQLERERLEKIESDKAAKIEAKRQEDLRIERERVQELENELQRKKEQAEKDLKAAEALKQSELSKGDAAKVHDLISDLEALKSKYSFKSAKNKKMYSNVIELLDKVINHIN